MSTSLKIQSYLFLYIPIIKTKISSFQWIAINIIKEDTELPMDAKIKGPLRPLLSDQTPRKQAVSIAGTVRATLNNKIYWEAFLLTFWSILQWNNLLRDTTILFWRKTSASIWYLKYLVSAKINFVDIRNTHIHGCMFMTY